MPFYFSLSSIMSPYMNLQMDNSDIPTTTTFLIPPSITVRTISYMVYIVCIVCIVYLFIVSQTIIQKDIQKDEYVHRGVHLPFSLSSNMSPNMNLRRDNSDIPTSYYFLDYKSEAKHESPKCENYRSIGRNLMKWILMGEGTKTY